METSQKDDKSPYKSSGEYEPSEIEPDDNTETLDEGNRDYRNGADGSDVHQSEDGKPLFEQPMSKMAKTSSIMTSGAKKGKKKKNLKVKIMIKEEEKDPDDELTQYFPSVEKEKSLPGLKPFNEYGFIKSDKPEETNSDIIMMTGANFELQTFQKKEPEELTKKEKEIIK
jgi:hypothetical protein